MFIQASFETTPKRKFKIGSLHQIITGHKLDRKNISFSFVILSKVENQLFKQLSYLAGNHIEVLSVGFIL